MMKHTLMFKISFLILIFSALALRAQEIPFESNEPSTKKQAAPVEKEIPVGDVPNTPASNVPTPGQLATPGGFKSPNGKPLPRAELSGLDKLESFSDIAVISRKFLPKTNRFELSAGGGMILNDGFFNNVVSNFRLGFYFTEKYGVEAMGMIFSRSSKTVTDELIDIQGVLTQSFVTPKDYYGLAFKWVPIYGKMGLVNRRIIPFETYFLLGGGVTGTDQNTRPPTIHLGTGQMYAIRKWLAFRWDFSWFTYKSDSSITANNNEAYTGFYNNLHISMALSFFFPGAGYR